jgi:hypothetical protein
MSSESITERSPTSYFWLWLGALTAGLGAVLVAYPVAREIDSGDAPWPATLGLALAVVIALALVGKSTHVIVTSAFSDAYRVFRARHLFACASVLLVAGVLDARAVVVREPFRHVFAHGRISALDIVDVATVIAALVCLVGAGVALTGAWDARHDERNWHRSLRLHSRRHG